VAAEPGAQLVAGDDQADKRQVLRCQQLRAGLGAAVDAVGWAFTMGYATLVATAAREPAAFR
jgi:hypothetical protein